jgi:hypothetical protein
VAHASSLDVIVIVIGFFLFFDYDYDARSRAMFAEQTILLKTALEPEKFNSVAVPAVG